MHPATYARLQNTTWLNGDPLHGCGSSCRLPQAMGTGVTEDFEHYSPEVFAPSKSQQGVKTASEKRRLMLGRIRLKEGSEARETRPLRRLEAAVEANNLYADFGGGPDGGEAERCKACKTDDEPDEEFWNGLAEVKPWLPRVSRLDDNPREFHRGQVRLSRTQRLVAGRPGMNDKLTILGSG